MNKFSFFFKRPKIVIVTGKGKETAQLAISQVLSRRFKLGRDILICNESTAGFKFFLKKSRLPILVMTHIGEYHPEKEFFAGELQDLKTTTELAQILPAHGYLILNFDDETVRDVKNESRSHPLTFGFGLRANMRASDIVLTEAPGFGTNFKINYEGNFVPCWLEKLFGKENIYAALAAAAVGEVLGLNLVEVSEGLKSYQGISGRMRLVEGVKNSWILDDSENASSLSMLESLETLRRIKAERKIAVLGDILGIGKYTVEAHEAMGEKVAKSADILFTLGLRARFIGQGAQSKAMALEKIHQYDTIEEGKIALQNEIKEGDLVLVDGSKEMKMGKIIEEIRRR